MSRFLAVLVGAAVIGGQAPAQEKADDVDRLLLRLAPVPLKHTQPVGAMTFSRDGKTITTVSGADVVLWDAASGSVRRSWQLPQNLIARSAFDAHGARLALADGTGGIAVWDVASGRRQSLIKDSSGPCLGLSPDGKSMVSGCVDGKLGVWDTTTGKRRCQLPGSMWSGSLNVAFSADGKRVAAARPDARIGVWDTDSGNALQTLPAETDDPRVLSFAPNGKSLVASDRTGRVRVWELATGQARRQLQMPGEHKLTGGGFSPDGRTLLTSGTDGTVRLWELASGRERHRFPGHDAAIATAALSRDGRTVVSVGADHLVLVRDVSGLSPSATVVGAPSAPQDLDTAWRDLADDDGAKAYRAMAALARQPGEAVAFLKKRLQPAAVIAPAEIARLISDLDSRQFATREQAMKRLFDVHESAKDELEAVLRGKPSPEMRRRVEQLLDRVQRQSAPPERLRALRAVEVLDDIGGADVRRILQALAQGSPRDPLTQDARAALERLKD